MEIRKYSTVHSLGNVQFWVDIINFKTEEDLFLLKIKYWPDSGNHLKTYEYLFKTIEETVTHFNWFKDKSNVNTFIKKPEDFVVAT